MGEGGNGRMPAMRGQVLQVRTATYIAAVQCTSCSCTRLYCCIERKEKDAGRAREQDFGLKGRTERPLDHAVKLWKQDNAVKACAFCLEGKGTFYSGQNGTSLSCPAK